MDKDSVCVELSCFEAIVLFEMLSDLIDSNAFGVAERVAISSVVSSIERQSNFVLNPKYTEILSNARIELMKNI